jgi:HEAT repeat protein
MSSEKASQSRSRESSASRGGSSYSSSSETAEVLIASLPSSNARQSRRKKQEIVRKLGQLDQEATPAAIPVLCRLLREDQDVAVRRYAAMALGRLGHADASSFLISALSDPDDPTKQWAARALGQIRARDGVDALRQVLSSPVAGLRGWAAWSLGEIGDQRATLGIISLLDDRKRAVRHGAAQALRSWEIREQLHRLRRQDSEGSLAQSCDMRRKI